MYNFFIFTDHMLQEQKCLKNNDFQHFVFNEKNTNERYC